MINTHLIIIFLYPKTINFSLILKFMIMKKIMSIMNLALVNFFSRFSLVTMLLARLIFLKKAEQFIKK
jgi:hypothetical protein